MVMTVSTWRQKPRRSQRPGSRHRAVSGCPPPGVRLRAPGVSVDRADAWSDGHQRLIDFRRAESDSRDQTAISAGDAGGRLQGRVAVHHWVISVTSFLPDLLFVHNDLSIKAKLRFSVGWQSGSMSTPQTASQFLATLGVNVHVEYTDGKYANATNVISDLAYLGETHVRDAVLDPGNQGQSSYDALASAGIKFDFFVQGNNLATTLSLVNAFVSRHPGAVSLIEGPNEVNNFPISYNGQSGNAGAQAFQAALYAAVHSDASLAGVPVANLTSWPALSGAADYANFHAYPINGAEPQGLTAAVNEEAAVEPGLPMVMTEGGYTTLLAANNFGGVDETTQAKLLLNLYCDNAKNGIATTYIYQLLDAYADPANNNPDDHFGLFNLDNTPKLAATAIHNLTSVLSSGADAGAAATSLNFTVSNLPSLGSVLSLTKNSTTHDILVWSEPTIWDATAQAPVAAASTNVTIHLAGSANVRVYDPLSSGQAIATYSGVQDVVVAVTDHPEVIEVTAIPAAAPVAVNHTPVLAGSVASALNDHSSSAPFAAMSVSDPDAGQTETVTVSFDPTSGSLAGGGFTQVSSGLYRVTAASASAAQADLEALRFTPTAQPSGTADTVTAFTVSVSDGQASASDTATSVTVSHTTNTPVTLAGLSAGQSTTDKVAMSPFSGAVVTDPDLRQIETVTVTLSAPGVGALSGGGVTAVTGATGVYQLTAASAAQAQAALRAVVFTPTQNLVAAGATSVETFTVQVSDGASTVRDASTTATITGVDDAPVVSGLQATTAAVGGGSVLLQPNLSIVDPDTASSVVSAKVEITGFVVGDTLTTAATPPGVVAAFDAASGVLTLTGAASDEAYAQALRSVSFGHSGQVDAGTRSVSFTLTDDGGATTTVAETVSVPSFTVAVSPPTAPTAPVSATVVTTLGPSTAVTSPTTVSSGTAGPVAASDTSSTVVAPQTATSASFTAQAENLLRVSSGDTVLTGASNALAAQVQTATTLAAQVDAGQVTATAAQTALLHLADGTTSVAELTYEFFTGSTPTALGLSYLVHSDANASDLNDTYFSQFSMQNRYINFSVALAKGGAGTAAYHAAYDGLDLSAATEKAYTTVFGAAASTDKVSAILNTAVSNGLGGIETRAEYFAAYGGDGPNGSGTKAAMIGWLLAEGVSEGVGTYQAAETNFLQALAHGTAQFGVDLLNAYAVAPTLVGAPTIDPTLAH